MGNSHGTNAATSGRSASVAAQRAGLPAEVQPGGSRPTPVRSLDDYATRNEALARFPAQFGGGGVGGYRLNVDALDPKFLAFMYGDQQLGAVLSTQTTNNLKLAAQEAGLATTGTRAQLLSRLTAFGTNGRYSANFAAAAPRSASAPRATSPARQPRGPSAATQRENSARAARHAESAATRQRLGLPDEAPANAPLRPHAVIPGYQLDTTRTFDPSFIVQHFGEHQLGAALAKQTAKGIDEAATAAGVTPGHTRAETISRIVAKVTNGHYSADF